MFDRGFYRVIGGPPIHRRLWGGWRDGPADTRTGKESGRGDYCLSTEELQAARLPAAAADDGRRRRRRFGCTGERRRRRRRYGLWTQLFPWGRERKGEREGRDTGSGELAYLAANLEILFVPLQLVGG